MHNEAKERWKKSPKGIKLQIRHSYNMSKKVRFYFHHLHFQNYRKQKSGEIVRAREIILALDLLCKTPFTLERIAGDIALKIAPAIHP